ncbi:MAG TPA: outer membrane beta-barrel protein [Kofleriaceae bacterium]|nr:outer membrane beta-barrel protein [Kofleriaceae bacterium]
MRFRLDGGLSLEPLLVLGKRSDTAEAGMAESTTTTIELAIGVNARYPLASRGPVDLVAIGGLGFGWRTTDPDGVGDETTTSAAIVWGLGLDYWLGPHWQISMSATNPLVQYESVAQNVPMVPDTSQSSTTLGLAFDPKVTAMVHLYY